MGHLLYGEGFASDHHVSRSDHQGWERTLLTTGIGVLPLRKPARIDIGLRDYVAYLLAVRRGLRSIAAIKAKREAMEELRSRVWIDPSRAA